MTKQELITKALDILNSDDSALREAVEELASYSGFAEDCRCFDMGEFDSFYGGMAPSELLGLIADDFNINDNYFYSDIYGVKSTDYPEDVYRQELDMGEIVDNLVDDFPQISLYNSALSEVISALYNEEYNEGDDTEGNGAEWLDEE